LQQHYAHVTEPRNRYIYSTPPLDPVGNSPKIEKLEKSRNITLSTQLHTVTTVTVTAIAVQ